MFFSKVIDAVRPVANSSGAVVAGAQLVGPLSRPDAYLTVMLIWKSSQTWWKTIACNQQVSSRDNSMHCLARLIMSIASRYVGKYLVWTVFLAVMLPNMEKYSTLYVVS